MRTVESSSGLWAPTFRYHKGKWYMMCSCFWKAGTSGVSIVSRSAMYIAYCMSQGSNRPHIERILRVD
jgi:beta-xylosidase